MDRFICASDLIRSMLLQDGVPAETAVTVHEGIDLSHVAAAPPMNIHEEFWLPHQAPVVGNVAALVPHKGQRHLIEAAARVVREVPDARFVIAGEGELRPALERQIKERKLEKHVFLAGFRPDVLSLHKSFDVFVLASVTEGLGTSTLDAMACGKPVVGTATGGIPEVVVDGETGLLVPPRDDRALAAAIVRLLKDRRPAGADGRGGARPRGRPLQRRAHGARHARRLRARREARRPRQGRLTKIQRAAGWQRPRSGQCAIAPGRVEAARVHHAQVAQREVVADGIDRVERAERLGDLHRHRPARRAAAGQAQARPTRITWVSSGTTSRAGATPAHTPMSISSRRTIHRR